MLVVGLRLHADGADTDTVMEGTFRSVVVGDFAGSCNPARHVDELLA